MQSSRPDASTNLSTVCFSRADKPCELKGMCTSLNFATRSARFGTTYSFVADAELAEGLGCAADCGFAADGESAATAIAANAASSSNEREVRARLFVMGVIGRRFYRQK